MTDEQSRDLVRIFTDTNGDGRFTNALLDKLFEITKLAHVIAVCKIVEMIQGKAGVIHFEDSIDSFDHLLNFVERFEAHQKTKEVNP